MGPHDSELVLVVDVEATCWQTRAPADEKTEIIEVGACLVHPINGARPVCEGIFVKPVQSRVSGFCTDLTSIRPEDVREAGTFAEACARLEREFGSRERPWASWGSFDRKQFEAQCAEAGIRYPFSDRHLNVKRLFGHLRNLRRDPGMARALETLGLPLEGRHHRGMDDAYNLAAILVKLLGDYELTLERALAIAREPQR